MRMQPRLPRSQREEVPATCVALRELAAAYAPTLVFADDEHFFPVLAEAYLAHTTYAPWPDEHGPERGTGLDHLLEPDGRQRGTALVRTETDGDALELTRVGGAPNAHGRPLQFSADAGDPDAIGRADRAGAAGAGLHLVVGGWADADRTSGDDAYLASIFSEFGDAMNVDAGPQWDDPERPALATFWVDQPTSPTTYAEVEWCGRFPDLAAAAGLGDFGPAPDAAPVTRLDGFVQLTYYYLFPVRRPADPSASDGVARMEGQWQAVTLFFRAQGSASETDSEGRPEDLVLFEPPAAAALSNQVDASVRAEVHSWDALQKFQLTLQPTPTMAAVAALPQSVPVESTSPVIYVGQGTHAFFKDPTSGQSPYGQDTPTPSEEVDTADFTDEMGVGGFFLALLAIIAAIVALAIAVAILAAVIIGIALLLGAGLAALLAIAIGALVLFAILAVLAIIAGIFWLEDWFDSDGDAPHQHEGSEEATGSSTAGEPPPGTTDGSPGPPADSAAAGGDRDPDENVGREGSDVASGGYPSGTGAPLGHDVEPFDVRVVDRINGHAPTRFPAEPGTCELPHWWSYSGAWGVPVRPTETARWRGGLPRVDEHGRSWGYWHAVAFDEAGSAP